MKLRYFTALLGTAAAVAVVLWVRTSDASDSRAPDLHDSSELASQADGLREDSRKSRDAAPLSDDAPQTRTRIETESKVGETSRSYKQAIALPKTVREAMTRILNANIATSEKEYEGILRSWKNGASPGLDDLKKEAEMSYDIESARSALRALQAGQYLVSHSNADTSGFVDAAYASKKYAGLFAIDGKSFDLTIKWKAGKDTREAADLKRMEELQLSIHKAWCGEFNSKPLNARRILVENEARLLKRVRECKRNPRPSLEEAKACTQLSKKLFPSGILIDQKTLRARVDRR